MSNRGNKRKEQTYQNLLDIKNVLEENKIFWWIQNGLLLGLYRDGDMVEGDENDADIGIFAKDVDIFASLMPKFEELKFRTRVTRTPYKTSTITLKRNATKVHVHVNCIKDNIVYQPMDKSGRVFIFSKDVYDGFSTIEWSYTKFNCPRNIKKYLTERYGKWRIPITKADGWTVYNDKKFNPCFYNNLKEYESSNIR